MRVSFLIIILLMQSSGCSYSNEINIIYSSDIWGETSHCGCPGHPTGGLPRKASFLKETRKNYKGIYYFEIGDTFYRPGTGPHQVEAEMPKVDMFIEFFNRERLDVFVPGETDLLMGIDTLKERLRSAKFKTLLSNMVEKGTGKGVFDRTYIDRRYGRKVCVFSLISPEFYKNDSYDILEPVSVAREILSGFEKSGCEFNILLSHLGYSMDVDFLKEMADSKLDLLIGSHDGGWMSTPRRDGNLLTVYGYRRGQAVGHIGFVGSLDIKKMKDATEAVEDRETLTKLKKELNRITSAAKGNNPEEFYRNDSNTLMRIKMIKDRITNLEKRLTNLEKVPYYFNRVVAMDTALEDSREVEEMVKAAEAKIKR